MARVKWFDQGGASGEDRPLGWDRGCLETNTSQAELPFGQGPNPGWHAGRCKKMREGGAGARMETAGMGRTRG